MMRVDKIRWVLAIVLVLFVVGCQSGLESVSEGEPQKEIQEEIHEEIQEETIDNRQVSIDPVLTIEWKGGKVEFSASELLAHPETEMIPFEGGGSYGGGTLKMQAIPVGVLFTDVPLDRVEAVEFESTDGFASFLEPELLFSDDPDAPRALVAIEDPADPWPPLRPGEPSAGPFYLVWQNAPPSLVGQEQWPYQLRYFRLSAAVEERFPGLLPDPALPADDPVRSGQKVFLRNCFACHTLNGEGNSQMGPDLNQPYSPTEYLAEGFLRRLVRDPQSLRHWPESKMSAFSESSLPDSELDQLILYLEHMAVQRRSQEAK